MSVAWPRPASAFDTDGFLQKFSDWTPAAAEPLAARDNIGLSQAHWEVLNLLRQYYETYDASPAMRPLVKYCRLELGADKGTSLYLLKLFPGSPAKIGSKIAGLPKPDNCL